jgi:hypothetical protein
MEVTETYRVVVIPLTPPRPSGKRCRQRGRKSRERSTDERSGESQARAQAPAPERMRGV